ncbi:hypothetical protein ACFLYY_01990 [Patescibacteria group bacterium]
MTILLTKWKVLKPVLCYDLNMINIFKSFTLKWWQSGVFKVTAISAGIYIGAYWADFFSGWLEVLLTIFIVGWIYLAYVWLKK